MLLILDSGTCEGKTKKNFFFFVVTCLDQDSNIIFKYFISTHRIWWKFLRYEIDRKKRQKKTTTTKKQRKNKDVYKEFGDRCKHPYHISQVGWLYCVEWIVNLEIDTNIQIHYRLCDHYYYYYYYLTRIYIRCIWHVHESSWKKKMREKTKKNHSIMIKPCWYAVYACNWIDIFIDMCDMY